MRILITGADGQLGLELLQALKSETLIPLVWPAFDLLKPEAGEQILEASPDVIIHTAAYTNVDKAEQEPDVALAINADGTERVARAAEKARARLIYISTDYVFDGTKGRPYEENDSTNPLSAYGRSKREGELRALACCRNTLVARTAWLYSAHGVNFVKTIMRLAGEQRELRVVNDQHGCPTHAGDLARALSRVVHLPLKGIVHAVGPGACTWQELASAIVSFMAVPVNVLPISTKDAGRPAPRPRYGVLANRILAGVGVFLPHWKDSLAKFFEQQRVQDSKLDVQH